MSQNTEMKLPAPQKTGGMPLMEALSKRATNRSLDPARSLSDQQLSNLLWAAWGINRPDGRRTAASAMNRQEIDLYLVGHKAAYLYDAKEHSLKLVAEGDHRSEVSSQDFAKNGDWIVIFAADYDKMGGGNEAIAGIDAGLIAQNIYLYGASEGLGIVVHASVDRDTISKVLKLRPAQHIMIAQTVGIPTR
ncbi:SagB/ThcOx family dehydrogenase [Alistipes indistinctus]|uniref:SagB/ThcOx family dehydrogenase n=1 Tax=Alistipes indistinctus TaxID=626932 RepID=UPI001F55304C|nr:SagB/ThcOx family dehydrogenase [Alistipes indistinctus]